MASRPVLGQRILESMEERILAVVTAKAKMDRSQKKPTGERCRDCNDESLPRNRWKLARVHETFPNDDGLVRKVKMAIATESLDDSGRPTKPIVFLERPVQKVILLLPSDRVEDQGIPTKEPQR